MRPLKRDYAPSRWRYRLSRWWLSPRVRLMVKRGLPLSIIAMVVGGLAANPHNQAWVRAQVMAAHSAVVDHPEFAVLALEIEGAGADLTAEVADALAVELPASSLRLDLDEARARVEALAPIDTAQLTIGPDKALKVRVTERIPVAVWRDRQGLHLVDPHGVVVSDLSPAAERPDLPMIFGTGAATHVGEALALADAAGPIGPRIRGMVRVGERRWDIALDRGQRILLPESGAVEALLHVLALHLSEEMLERDIEAIDMRDRTRPTVRLTDHAVREMRRLRAMEAGEDA